MHNTLVSCVVFCGFLLLSPERSRAQGQPDIRLTNDAAFSATTFDNARSVAVSGSTVHVAWFDERDGNREIYYKRSPDDGATWGPDVRLTNNAAISNFPSITASGASVHVVWVDLRDGNAEIYYKRSTNDGLSFGPDVRLTTNSAASFACSAAASGSDVHVVWYDMRQGNWEIFYKRSVDGGQSFGADTRLTNDGAASLFPGVSASGTEVHVLWEEYRDGAGGEIYYKHSGNGGQSFGPDTRLTFDAAASFSPSVSASGDGVHAVWFDERDGNREIYYKRSTNGGASWGSDVRLTNDPGVSSYACVSAAGPFVHVAWIDERDGNLETYYNHSADGGATFGPETRLTIDPARSTDPSVAASGSLVHVIWTDARDAGLPYDGNYEIYYERESFTPPIAGVVFCAGDGVAPHVPCPCGNNSSPADAVGCLNSFGVGARLRATGLAQLSFDTVVLQADNLPASSALFFQGTTQQGAGNGSLFGDGLRCAGGITVRLRTYIATGSPGSASTSFPQAGDPALSVRGGVSVPGMRTYQAWYRNPAAFCSAFPYNLSNGLQVDWQP
jgi:hypothetical protein